MTLTTIQTAATRQILTLASISSLSLLTAYSLAGPRGKHPYLLWTALVGFLGGQGVEWWFNGFSRFPSLKSSSQSRQDTAASSSRRTRADEGSPSGSGYVDVTAVEEDDSAAINGEKVEAEMVRERRVQRIRTLVSGLGFAMGVVGIWGDGA